MQLLTTSRRACYARCKREHYYKYELRRRPKEKAYPLTFGTMIHHALEQWWRSIKKHQHGTSMHLGSFGTYVHRDLCRALVNAWKGTGLDEFELQRAQAMLDGYHARWLDRAKTMEIIDVEARFEYPLANPDSAGVSRTFRRAGKIDVIVVSGGRNWIVEHKTTSEDISAGSPYWQRLRMDAQISEYYDGGESLGYPIGGCIYDVLKKPKQTPLLATPVESRRYRKSDGKLDARQRERDELPEEFYRRVMDAISKEPERWYQWGRIVHLPSDLTEHRRDNWITAKAMRETQNANAHARNPDACVNRYGIFCPYFDVCSGVASINDNTRFETTAQHPELA